MRTLEACNRCRWDQITVAADSVELVSSYQGMVINPEKVNQAYLAKNVKSQHILHL